MRKLIIGCMAAALTMFSPPSEGTPAGINPLNTAPFPPTRQFGVASWYGEQFQGLETASGTPFDMNAMTCAHRELPLGTRIRVTDLLNLKSVVLKVNDRGPYICGRDLDVSRAAAKCLGFVGAGLAPVRIEVIRYPRRRITILPRPTILASATRPADR